MREEGDTIEAFNRRVRNNEAAAKRVHDLNPPRKATQPATNSSRVQRLFGNLAAKELAETDVKPITSQAKATFQKENKPRKALEATKTKGNERKREPLRPCRHCGGNHWDNDCTDSKKVLKIDPDDMDIDQDEDKSNEENNEDLDSYDLETYAALEALAEGESMDSQGEHPPDS